MTPSLSIDRDAERSVNWSRTLVFSWFLVCLALAACLADAFWWIQVAASTAFAFTRWPARLLKAEKEVSREASWIHQSMVVFGCLLVMALATVEMIYGRHAAMFDVMWKSGAGIMLCAQLAGDVLLWKEVRRLKR